MEKNGPRGVLTGNLQRLNYDSWHEAGGWNPKTILVFCLASKAQQQPTSACQQFRERFCWNWSLVSLTSSSSRIGRSQGSKLGWKQPSEVSGCNEEKTHGGHEKSVRETLIVGHQGMNTTWPDASLSIDQ